MRLDDYFAEAEKKPENQRAAKKLKPLLDLADVVIRARLAKNWSQSDLADSIGTKQANISRIESGLANPTFSLLSKLFEALDIEVRYSHVHEKSPESDIHSSTIPSSMRSGVESYISEWSGNLCTPQWITVSDSDSSVKRLDI